MRKTTPARLGIGRAARSAAAALAVLLAGCSSLPEPVGGTALEQRSLRDGRAASRPSAARPSPALDDPPPEAPYLLGPGDVVRVAVEGRPELGAEHALGPDGGISVPLAGPVRLGGLDRRAAADRLETLWRPYFRTPPRASVDVVKYENDRAFVLGRVESPGAVDLTAGRRVLQVLARAGALPVRDGGSFLSRCAVIRGKDEIHWIDLVALTQYGDLAQNVALRNGDVLFLPDAEDTFVFVMGEVRNPGPAPVKVRLTVMQALAHAGGPAEDADLEQVWLVRDPTKGEYVGPVRLDLKGLIERADFRDDLELRPGDVLYVGRTGLGDLGYVLRKLGGLIPAAGLGVALSGG